MLTRLNTEMLWRNRSKKGHQEQNIVPKMRLKNMVKISIV